MDQTSMTLPKLLYKTGEESNITHQKISLRVVQATDQKYLGGGNQSGLKLKMMTCQFIHVYLGWQGPMHFQEQQIKKLTMMRYSHKHKQSGLIKSITSRSMFIMHLLMQSSIMVFIKILGCKEFILTEIPVQRNYKKEIKSQHLKREERVCRPKQQTSSTKVPVPIYGKFFDIKVH